MQNRTKFIVITGGVISGLGKGSVTASVCYLLQSQGYNVTPVKIDPYINVDAGTMRPTEHGEVFVLEDGAETDQDLGIYERFLGKDLSRENNITTGQVYLAVIEKERNLEFDGKCVEVIPHIPQEVEKRLKELGKKTNADFVVVEIGGTVGDYQNVLFLEAARQMHLKSDPVAFIHIVYLPIPKNLGEMKTKPAQHSVRMLNEVGIQPDFIVARSERPLDNVRKEKLSIFCNVRPEFIISDPDCDSVYELPLVFDMQSFTKKLLERFDMQPKSENGLSEWEGFVSRIKSAKHEVNIGIVGKYFDTGEFTLEDSYISVIEAVKHAAWHNNAKPKIQWIDSKEFEKEPARLEKLRDFGGIIVPGGFGDSGVEGKILAIKFCRENKIPYLGLCYGMQLAVVEFARNICGMKGANTTEIDPHTKYPVIDILPEQKKKIAKKQYGGTMRLGSYTALLKAGSIVSRLYGGTEAKERHRHRYEINPEYIKILEKHGIIFSGYSPDRRLMEFMELPKHPFFVATQAHPELQSKALRPSPVFLGFIKACMSKKVFMEPQLLRQNR